MAVDFKRKVNKEKIPVCEIMGENVAAINMSWLLEFTDKHIKDLSGDYLCVSNVYPSRFVLN
ncbi:hypothetical protein DWX43_12300 [Clostridium sp. AF19-22AC]|jgi:N-acetylglucosaminyldiphosphoundecaprenol N-acetyl-beta-D-mannosaminyltransferase|nr:hypothetical protein DWX43_12300 [Clostridium sp. AF19-22AC]